MHNIAKYKSYFKVKFFLIKFETSRVLNFKATKWKLLQEQIKTSTKVIKPEENLFSINDGEDEVDPNVELEEIEKANLSPSSVNNDLKPIVEEEIKESETDEGENEKNEGDSKTILDFESIVAENSLIKLTRYYHEGLTLKRGIDFYFNYYLKQAYFKKLLLKNKKIKFKELLKLFLIKPFFKLEILLWHLGLFKSTRQILQLLNTNRIFINEKVARPGAILYEGDVISFKNVNLQPIETIKVLPYILVEIDFFCNKIILIKGYTTLNDLDIKLLFPNVSFDFLKFLNYIRRQ